MHEETPPARAFEPAINRIRDLMFHTRRYVFLGLSRLARDCQVSPTTLSRVLNRQINPSFALVARIASALEKDLGKPIDPRELIAEGGRFPTCFACDLLAVRVAFPRQHEIIMDTSSLSSAESNLESGLPLATPKDATRKRSPMNGDPLMWALQGCSLHALLMLVSRALSRAGSAKPAHLLTIGTDAGSLGSGEIGSGVERMNATFSIPSASM